ncbi:MAG: hypothetical protein ACM3KE_15425 [Hyphomicrobiales bacterium]
MADEVAYTSHVKIERMKGPLRRAYLPHVATLDYVVAATAG